jgi:hypothetical protein
VVGILKIYEGTFLCVEFSIFCKYMSRESKMGKCGVEFDRCCNVQKCDEMIINKDKKSRINTL